MDPELGLYHALEGGMARLTDDADIERALTEPPADTRAAVRGEFIRRFGSDIRRVAWGRLLLNVPGGVGSLPLPPELGGRDAADDWRARMEAAKTVAEAADAVFGPSGEEYVPDQG